MNWLTLTLVAAPLLLLLSLLVFVVALAVSTWLEAHTDEQGRHR